MASLPYPLNRMNNHDRVDMAGMPYPPTDCHSYITINMTTYLVGGYKKIKRRKWSYLHVLRFSCVIRYFLN